MNDTTRGERGSITAKAYIQYQDDGQPKMAMEIAAENVNGLATAGFVEAVIVEAFDNSSAARPELILRTMKQLARMCATLPAEADKGAEKAFVAMLRLARNHPEQLPGGREELARGNKHLTDAQLQEWLSEEPKPTDAQMERARGMVEDILKNIPKQ